MHPLFVLLWFEDTIGLVVRVSIPHENVPWLFDFEKMLFKAKAVLSRPAHQWATRTVGRLFNTGD